MFREITTSARFILLLVIFQNLFIGSIDGRENEKSVNGTADSSDQKDHGNTNVKVSRRAASSDPEWSYKDQDKWADLGYKDCSGTKQSPIFCKREDSEWKYSPNLVYSDNYFIERDDAVLKNNGKWPVISLPEDSKDVPCVEGGDLNGKFCFEKVLFHFGSDNDAGAEHNWEKFNENFRPLKSAFEIQLFHTNEDKSTYLILTTVFTAAKENDYNVTEGLKPVLKALPKVEYANQETKLEKMNLSLLVPLGLGKAYTDFYYRYNGSLTFPPCTENVIWVLFREEEVYINLDTLQEFRKLKSTSEDSGDPQSMANNYRKQQDLNGRYLLDRKTYNR